MYVAENDCHKRESESARLREPLDANGVRIVHATMPRPGHDAMRGTRPVHDRHMILPAPPPRREPAYIVERLVVASLPWSWQQQ